MPHWVHAFVHWLSLHCIHPFLHWLSLHWGDVLPTWLGVILAAVFGWQSWCSSRRSAAAEGRSREAEEEAREQADRATKAAEDAVAAAERSAAAEERSATAQETQARLAQDQATADEQAPWRVTRHGQMDFRLVNRTKTRKYEVVVNGEPARTPPGVFRPGSGRANQFAVVDGSDTVELDLFVAMQTRDRSVTVSWRPTPDHTGDPWTQRCGLP